MVPLIIELSRLEVEILEIAANMPESEQDSRLDTLTTQGDIEVAALLTGNGDFPTNGDCCCCGKDGRCCCY